jgi:hypothetical protein
MKRLNLLLTTGLLLAMPMVMRATILGGPHDFSTNSWNTPEDVCETCHTPHASDTTYHIPLWNHTMSANAAGGNYVPYTSPTFVANVGVAAQPDGPSLACLSCHDGTVAINSFFNTPYGDTTTNSQFIKASHNVTWNGNGTDLSHNHPISFVYGSALATKMGDLNDPIGYTIGSIPVYPGTQTNNVNIVAPIPSSGWAGTSLTGQSIDQAMLWNHEMECSSCHDVHGMAGSSASGGILLKVSGTDSKGRGDLICRTCHMK